jgi:hypothetical protein
MQEPVLITHLEATFGLEACPPVDLLGNLRLKVTLDPQREREKPEDEPQSKTLMQSKTVNRKPEKKGTSDIFKGQNCN